MTILTKLNEDLKSIGKKIKPTVDDTEQFKSNIKNNFKYEDIDLLKESIKHSQSLINKQVYSLDEKYISVEESTKLDEKTKQKYGIEKQKPILYTEKRHEEFVLNEIFRTIHSHKTYLINGALNFNSVDKFKNLAQEINLVSRQELIIYYTNIYKQITNTSLSSTENNKS